MKFHCRSTYRVAQFSESSCIAVDSPLIGTVPRIGAGFVSISTVSSVEFCHSPAARSEAALGSSRAFPVCTTYASNSVRLFPALRTTAGRVARDKGSRTIRTTSMPSWPHWRLKPARLASDLPVSTTCMTETASALPRGSLVFTNRHPPSSCVVWLRVWTCWNASSSHRRCCSRTRLAERAHAP